MVVICLNSMFQGCIFLPESILFVFQIPYFDDSIAFLQEFKITVMSILSRQPEKDMSWWPVDLCRGPRCGWHGDSVKWEPQTTVHVHKQTASDCPRRHLQCLWFPYKMTTMSPPRRPSVSARFRLILCPHVLHFHALLELLEVPELLWSFKPSCFRTYLVPACILNHIQPLCTYLTWLC